MSSRKRMKCQTFVYHPIWKWGSGKSENFEFRFSYSSIVFGNKFLWVEVFFSEIRSFKVLRNNYMLYIPYSYTLSVLTLNKKVKNYINILPLLSWWQTIDKPFAFFLWLWPVIVIDPTILYVEEKNESII